MTKQIYKNTKYKTIQNATTIQQYKNTKIYKKYKQPKKHKNTKIQEYKNTINT